MGKDRKTFRLRRFTVACGLAAAVSLAAAPAAQAHESHRVASGETLSGIARHYGTSVTALAAKNGIADPDLVFAGTTLVIPDGDGVSSSASASTAPAPSGGSVTDIILSAAAQQGVDGAYLVSIASCESSLNPSAVNPAGYYGLFQFDKTTWAEYGSGSIFDPAAQASAAAGLIAAGQSSRWPVCG